MGRVAVAGWAVGAKAKVAVVAKDRMAEAWMAATLVVTSAAVVHLEVEDLVAAGMAALAVVVVRSEATPEGVGMEGGDKGAMAMMAAAELAVAVVAVMVVVGRAMDEQEGSVVGVMGVKLGALREEPVGDGLEAGPRARAPREEAREVECAAAVGWEEVVGGQEEWTVAALAE